MTVSIVSLCARGEDGVCVCFEIRSEDGVGLQRESLLVSVDTVCRLGLCVGVCDCRVYDLVAEAAELYLARKRALYLLGYGACSPRRLCRRLCEKGIRKEVAERAVRRLIAEGYINPAEDAFREAEKCLTKLWGKKRIAAALYEKGYSDTDIKEAFLALDGQEVDFAELCLKRIKQTEHRLPTERAERQKLIARLYRYGFSSEEIREAFSQLEND